MKTLLIAVMLATLPGCSSLSDREASLETERMRMAYANKTAQVLQALQQMPAYSKTVTYPDGRVETTATHYPVPQALINGADNIRARQPTWAMLVQSLAPLGLAGYQGYLNKESVGMIIDGGIGMIDALGTQQNEFTRISNEAALNSSRNMTDFASSVMGSEAQ
jgi:hypothetical protein